MLKYFHYKFKDYESKNDEFRYSNYFRSGYRPDNGILYLFYDQKYNFDKYLGDFFKIYLLESSVWTYFIKKKNDFSDEGECIGFVTLNCSKDLEHGYLDSWDTYDVGQSKEDQEVKKECFAYFEKDENHVIYIDKIMIFPDSQNKGYARSVFSKILGLSITNEAKFFYFYAPYSIYNNESQAKFNFYKKLGFRAYSNKEKYGFTLFIASREDVSKEIRIDNRQN